jgi:glycosyltransferase involved in cell wall biosynthesis
MWLEMNFFRPMKRLLLINLLRKRHASQPYACFIGMDPEGLISAAPLAKMLNIPLLYWSLELLFSSEITTQEKKQIKNQEITYSKQANFTIVQDPWRGQALIDENGLQLPRMQYVPNAPRGIARRKKSDYLHRCLNIDPGRKIILCAGTIDYWSMGIEIITAANNWPDDFVLVLQSRIRKDSWAGDYGKKIISLADPKKVVISYDPVPQADYRKFVDSADVGLAFYRSQEPQKTTDSTTTGENIRLMGLSSGKIAGYLFSGLPVIVNDAIIGPKELVKSTDCGICVSHPNEIKEALEIIFYCYDWYVENACKCFEQNLELEKHFSPVISQIGKL